MAGKIKKSQFDKVWADMKEDFGSAAEEAYDDYIKGGGTKKDTVLFVVTVVKDRNNEPSVPVCLADHPNDFVD